MFPRSPVQGRESWGPDPWRRFYQRHWDGTAWTNRVADAQGSEGIDSEFRSDEPPPGVRVSAISNEEFQARFQGRQVLIRKNLQYVGGFTRYWIALPAGHVDLTVTDQAIHVDHFVKKKLGAALRERIDQSFQTKESGRHALFEFPTQEIQEVLIQPFEAALAVGAAGVAVPIGDTGVSVGGLGGSVRQQQWSGISFVLNDGQRILFKTYGPPVTVQTELATLIRFVHGRTPSALPPRAAATGSGDRYQQLRELASLRDDGILTEDELAREKARLLADEPGS